MAEIPDPTYEKRLILFLDFLGFKEIVADTQRNRQSLKRLLNAMEAISEVGGNAIFPSMRFTQFSDSVVVSYRIEERSGVFWLLNAMALTVIRLTELGYLLRGAVTMGDLLHTERHVVGPAMVTAYEMESRLAKYPRVIVDPRVIDVSRKHRSKIHSPDDEAEYVGHYLKRDEDGQFFFDYISWNTVVDIAGADDNGYGQYLSTIGDLVGTGLRHSESSVRKKYLWIHGLYVAAIEEFVAIPANHPYRLQSPENCRLIENLPKYVELASHVRREGRD